MHRTWGLAQEKHIIDAIHTVAGIFELKRGLGGWCQNCTHQRQHFQIWYARFYANGICDAAHWKGMPLRPWAFIDIDENSQEK